MIGFQPIFLLLKPLLMTVNPYVFGLYPQKTLLKSSISQFWLVKSLVFFVKSHFLLAKSQCLLVVFFCWLNPKKNNHGFVVKIHIYVDQMPLFCSKTWSNISAPPWGPVFQAAGSSGADRRRGRAGGMGLMRFSPKWGWVKIIVIPK